MDLVGMCLKAFPFLVLLMFFAFVYLFADVTSNQLVLRIFRYIENLLDI